MAVTQEHSNDFTLYNARDGYYITEDGNKIHHFYFEFLLPSLMSRKYLRKYLVNKYTFLPKYAEDDVARDCPVGVEPAFLDYDSLTVYYQYDEDENGNPYEERVEFCCYYLTLDDNGDIRTNYDDGFLELKLDPDDEKFIIRKIDEYIDRTIEQKNNSEV